MTTVALVIAVVLSPLIAYWLVTRSRLAPWGGVVITLPILALTPLPTSRDQHAGCAAEWSFPTLGAVEPMANVMLFVLPVLLLGVARDRERELQQIAARFGGAYVGT